MVLLEQSEQVAHPLGVLPSSNLWLTDRLTLQNQQKHRKTSLGRYFETFLDETLVDFLGFLDAGSLATLCSVSKFLFVFASHEPLWRELTLRLSSSSNLKFKHTWKETLLGTKLESSPRCATVVYSDTLYRTWQYARTEISPTWLQYENVKVRDALDFGVDDFLEEFEKHNEPVLIKNALSTWGAFKRWGEAPKPASENLDTGNINLGYLEKIYSNKRFRAGPANLSLQEFVSYCQGPGSFSDEDPLYIFDSTFQEQMPSVVKDYSVPVYFKNSRQHPHRDLLECMDKLRPDYRWLIAGTRWPKPIRVSIFLSHQCFMLICVIV